MTEADKLRAAMIALIAQNAELIKRIAELEQTWVQGDLTQDDFDRAHGEDTANDHHRN
jgi:hypothetical protein